MSDWTQHNSQLFKKLIREEANRKKITLKLVLSSFANKVYNMIASTGPNTGDGFLPYYSGNLRDGTGVGVYYDGTLIKLIPPQSAMFSQNSRGHRRIWGTTFIQKALAGATSKYSKGLWVVVYSAAPYAVEINTYGSKYWESNWFDDRVVNNYLIPEFKKSLAMLMPELASQLTI